MLTAKVNPHGLFLMPGTNVWPHNDLLLVLLCPRGGWEWWHLEDSLEAGVWFSMGCCSAVRCDEVVSHCVASGTGTVPGFVSMRRRKRRR